MPPSGGLTEDNAGVVFSFPCRPDTIPGQRGRSQRYSAFFVFFPTDRRRRTLAYFEPSAQNRLYGPSEGLTDARSPEADRGGYPLLPTPPSPSVPRHLRCGLPCPSASHQERHRTAHLRVPRKHGPLPPRNVGSSRAKRGTLAWARHAPLRGRGFFSADRARPPLFRVGRLRGQEPVSPTLAVSRHRLPTAHHATRTRDLNTPHALPAP